MDRNICIEPFSLTDLESISNNLEKDFDKFWNYNILKKELKNPSNNYLCCRKNNEVVGFAGITIILDTAELNNIVVKKNERGNGYASLLLDELIKIAQNNNCSKINLEVSIENEIAINLYKKTGFKQVGIRHQYYNGVDALLFTLDI